MRLKFLPPTTLHAAALALLAAGLSTAQAQSKPAAPAPQVAAKPLGYTSAFEGYRAYKDQDVGNWRAMNERVGNIGGWRTYAREAQDDTPAPPEPKASAPAQGAHDHSKK